MKKSIKKIKDWTGTIGGAIVVGGLIAGFPGIAIATTLAAGVKFTYSTAKKFKKLKNSNKKEEIQTSKHNEQDMLGFQENITPMQITEKTKLAETD